MYDFLTFESFLTPKVLVVFYYMGVFFLPALLWHYKENVKFVYEIYNFKNKTKVMLYMFIVFVMMQIGWRMMFEMMIAYFDMHHYLQIISTHK
ncbi:MAG: DUF4282 domain-containing protein [Epsilonproteobacteria bacterium]|nr:DUF4282 domain-containing protein [Campylobacterota bacterium]